MKMVCLSNVQKSSEKERKRANYHHQHLDVNIYMYTYKYYTPANLKIISLSEPRSLLNVSMTFSERWL